MRQRPSLLTQTWAGYPTSRRRCSAIAALLVMLATLIVPAPVIAGPVVHNPPPASYRLGIFPYLAPRQTIEFYGPVVAGMRAALNQPVKLETVSSFGGFTEALSRQSYDIALIQPFDYPEAVEKWGYIPLAQLSVPLVSQFFVRSDSPRQKIEDLRGTTIAMPPAESAAARMTLRALYDNKLIPGRDVELHYFNSHDSCIQQVWIGDASACGTAPPPVSVFEARMHASLRPIYSTPPIPHVLFVVHSRVPAAQRAKLQAEIIRWSQTDTGRAMLKKMSLPGFVSPRPAEYALMRNYDVTASKDIARFRANHDLVLGVFPYLSPRQLAEYLAPMLPALRDSAGTPMHLRTATSFAKFSEGVAAGSYDVILAQPFEYALASRSGYLPLAGMKVPLQGTFYVRANSPYRKIVDFKGQAIALPPPESAMASLGRQALAEAGLTPGRDVTLDYRPTHDSCLRAVQQGKAAVCVTATIAPESIPAELTRNLRPVGLTNKVPGIVFMAHQRLPAKLRDRLQAEILSWKNSDQGRNILKRLGYSVFVPINPADYAALPHFEVPH